MTIEQGEQKRIGTHRSASAPCVGSEAFIRFFPAGFAIPAEVKSLQTKCKKGGKSVRECFEGKTRRDRAASEKR